MAGGWVEAEDREYKLNFVRPGKLLARTGVLFAVESQSRALPPGLARLLINPRRTRLELLSVIYAVPGDRCEGYVAMPRLGNQETMPRTRARNSSTGHE